MSESIKSPKILVSYTYVTALIQSLGDIFYCYTHPGGKNNPTD